ncbi:hypothetical protein LN040_11030 [Desulfovibrio subterraneus]|uniref:Uncharacterized protein n=1 Tax=Desulfovibrio subterraneus TaxID=2718620 RepID=A0A7J0BMS5_9BACT|nr:hypothetical protein [Desulfovibrio subterraneus]WBF66263.1 hypothetical protein LN040_11030 [Desulfovibrio subterraneus]GFM34908.1 hypothetical protein DSM101010T_32730 [Desulfovibrio subterraneus]
MQLLLILLCVSTLVGLLGINTRFGFWGNFFASMLLTPVVGLLLVVAASGKRPKPE